MVTSTRLHENAEDSVRVEVETTCGEGWRVCVCIDCTRKWIGNAAYIVYVTSLAILRTVTARGKLAGVTNDKESVLL